VQVRKVELWEGEKGLNYVDLGALYIVNISGNYLENYKKN